MIDGPYFCLISVQHPTSHLCLLITLFDLMMAAKFVVGDPSESITRDGNDLKAVNGKLLFCEDLEVILKCCQLHLSIGQKRGFVFKFRSHN